MVLHEASQGVGSGRLLANQLLDDKILSFVIRHQ
jgi:hypothetical protein